MVSIITSLNISVQKILTKTIEKQNMRKTILSIFAIAVFLLGGFSGYSQTPPTFTVCPGNPTVTLPAGNGGLTLNNSNIPSILGVMAVDPDAAEAITYSASPSTIDCSDIGPGFSIAITATDSDGTDVCNITVTIIDGGPFALCTNITVTLDGTGNYALTAGDLTTLSAGSNACTGIASVTANPPAFTCMDTGAPVLVTVTVFDGNGASAFCIANVTVQDTENPVFTFCPPDPAPVPNTGGLCTAPVVVAPATATDNCGVVITNNFNGGGANASGTYPVGTTTVTFTATDPSGNTNVAACTVDVVVNDTEAPNAVCNDITVELDATGNYSLTPANIAALSAGSSDNCSIVTTTSSINAFDCGDVGVNGVTITVTDPASLTDNCGANITVQDNIAPTINTCPIDVTIDTDLGLCTAIFNYATPTFDDNCGGTGQFGIRTVGLASGSAFPEGVNTVTHEFTDAGGTTIACTFTVTVEDNEGPVISNCPPSSAVMGTIQAVTNTGVCETTVGWLNPTTADACNGIASFTTTALDPGGNPIIITVGSAPPTPPCTPISLFAGYYDAGLWSTTGTVDISGAPASVELQEGSSFARTIEYDGVLSFDWSKTFGGGSFSYDLNGTTITIAGATVIAPATGSIEITVSAGDMFTLIQGTGFSSSETTISNFAFTCAAGAYGDFPLGISTVTYEATDNEGNVTTCTFNVEVTDGEDPVAVCQDITVQLDATGNASILATAVDAGSTDNCSIASRTLDVSTFDCTDVGANTVTLTVTDGAGNTNTCTATVTVQDNVAPTAICQNVTVQLDAAGNATVTAGMVDNGSSDACGIASTSLSQTAFDCTHVGNNLVTLTVTDNNGNVSTCNAQVTVQDLVAPTATCQNITVSLDGAGNVSITGAQIDGGSTDACGIASLVASPNAFNCSNIGANPVTLTVTDNNGNVSTCVATVTVQDIINPTVTCQNITVQLDGAGTVSIAATALVNSSNDNCGVVSTSASQTTFTCADLGANPVTVTVMDGSGNMGTCVATVTVEDNINPTITCPSNLTRDASATCDYTAGGGEFDPSTTDNCSATISHNYNGGGATLNGETFPLGSTNVTWTATDPSGNSVTCNITIVVEDNTDPVLTTPASFSQNVDLNQCDAVVTYVTSATDNCDVSVDIVCVPPSGSTFPVGPTTVTCTATDDAGNTDVSTFVVTVVENELPNAVCQNLTVQLDATGNASITANQIDNGSTDNCGISTITVSPNSFTCANVGANPVTLTVTDNNGNVSTCNATVTVEDNIFPTIVCPADITVSSVGVCDAFVTVPVPVLGDNCSATATNNFNGTSNASDTYPAGTTVVTWTVTDPSGNSTTCNMNVTVEDNELPELVCPTGSSIVTGTATVSVASGSTIPDDCGGILLTTIPSGALPAGAVIDDIVVELDMTHSWLGDLSATIETPDGNKVTIFARPGIGGGPINPDDNTYFCDGCCGFNNGLEAFLVTFDDASTNTANDFNDASGPLAGYNGADYNPLNAFSTLAGDNAEGDYNLRLYDGVGGDVGTLNNVTLTINYSYLLTNTSFDRETDPGVCTYTIQGSEFDPASWGDNCPGATLMHNLPPIIAPSSSTLAGAVLPLGFTNVTWTVTDASGNVTTCNIGITVTDIVAPTQTGGQADGTTINVNAMGGGCTAIVNWVAPTFTDNCLTPVIPSSTSNPGNVFSVGTHTVTYTAVDPSGNTTVVTFTIIVADGVAPIAGCQPVPINLFLDAMGQVTLTALDVNLGSTDNCGIDSYLISINGGPFATDHTFTCTDLGTYTVTLRVSDGTLTDECTSTVIVSDNIPPVASCQNVTVFLDASGNASITINDIDNGSSDNGQGCLVLSLNNTTFDCSDLGPNTVTLTASDAAGNTDACNATVTVIDALAPVISLVNVPADITVSCNTTLPGDPGNITATDNCDTPVIIYTTTTTQSGNPNNCANYSYTFTQTWTASDNSSNSSSVSRVITVVDNVAPTNPVIVDNIPANDTISTNPTNCVATVSLAVTSYTECAPFANLTITNNSAFATSGGADASGNYPIGFHAVQFTAVDPCGNTSNWTVSFWVQDLVAPVASCVNNLNLGLPSSGILVLSPAAVNSGSFDNCGVISMMTISPDTFTCADVGNTIPVTLRVWDDAGNSSTCNTSVSIQENNAPTAICQSITVFLDENGEATITADDIDNNSFDDCTPVTTSVTPTLFTDANLGNNTVTLTVMDENGNSSNCNATVTVLLPETCYNVGITAGGAGEIVSVPITSENFTSLVGFQFELMLNTETVGEFVGVSGVHPDLTNAYIEVLTNSDTTFIPIDTIDMTPPIDMDSIIFDTIVDFNGISFSWNQFNDDGMGNLLPITLPDGTVLFNVDVLLTGNIGDNSIIAVNPTSTTTPPEVVYSFGGGFIPNPACVNQGAVTIGELIIAGDIYNEFGNAINLVTVGLYPDPSLPATPPLQTVVTMTDGAYEFVLSAPGDYRVTPSKTINWSNGIDILDVSFIQRHSVGNPYVNSAYKKIAADVSGEGTITTFDAVLLNAYLASLFTATPPPTPSWQFVDAKQVLANNPNAFVPAFTNDIIFPNINSDSLGNDFIAVKTGDLGGIVSADTTMLGGNPDDRNDDALKFLIEDRALKAGEQVTIDVKAENFEQMAAYQWILEFDNEVLSYTGFDNVNLNNLGELGFGEVIINEGKLVLTWANGELVTKSKDEVLFSLNFEVKANVDHLRGLLNVTSYDRFAAVAYKGLDTPMEIELIFTQPVAQPSVFGLNQNTPNPFKDETVISFTLPETTNATLTIMDITGRVLKQYKGTYTQGYNEVSINKGDLPHSGTLFYELKTPDNTASRKMIIID
jgi:subtilisin-like proprotein convertase family protein